MLNTPDQCTDDTKPTDIAVVSTEAPSHARPDLFAHLREQEQQGAGGDAAARGLTVEQGVPSARDDEGANGESVEQADLSVGEKEVEKGLFAHLREQEAQGVKPTPAIDNNKQDD